MWIEKNGPTWRIRDLVAGKKVTIKAGYATKTAAKAAMVQAEADVLRGDALVPRGGRVGVGEWLDAWWPAYETSLKPSSRISAEGILRRYIRPMLGHLALEDVDPLVVQRWIADLLAGRTEWQTPLAVKTVRNAHGTLHKVMAEAVAQRLIRTNPCGRTGLPSRQHHEQRYLTEPEAGRLVAEMPEHWKPLVLLLLGTGLRWGEAIGLRVGANVDVLAGRLTVVETLQELTGGQVVTVTPKSRMSRRTVTFTRSVADALVPLVSGKERGDLVFTSREGQPIRASNFRRAWMPACYRAGLPGLRIHDLRHTHAAWLISANHPPTAIQRRLGHASIAVTMDIYGHLLPEVDEGILATLDEALPKIDLRGTVGETGDDQRQSTATTGDKLPGQSTSQPSGQGV